MTARSLTQCAHHGCREPLRSGGLCVEHSEQRKEAHERRDEALTLLHKGIVAGRVLSHPELKEELDRLWRWWREACHAVQSGRTDGILRDEAQYAVEWCIAIAKHICRQERSFRNGDVADPVDHLYKQPFWERFENLEAGRRSNGLPRS